MHGRLDAGFSDRHLALSDEPSRGNRDGSLREQAIVRHRDLKLINGKDGIPDVMLSRKFKRDRSRVEHLVLELKRPPLKLG